MKRCAKCYYCELDLVSQYVKGIDVRKCIRTGNIILEPYHEGKQCTMYCGKATVLDKLKMKLGVS